MSLFLIKLTVSAFFCNQKKQKFRGFDSPKPLKRPKGTAVTLWKPLPEGRFFDLGEAHTKARPVTRCRRVHEVYQKASAFSKLAWCLKPLHRGLKRGTPFFSFSHFWAVKSAKQLNKTDNAKFKKEVHTSFLLSIRLSLRHTRHALRIF